MNGRICTLAWLLTAIGTQQIAFAQETSASGAPSTPAATETPPPADTPAATPVPPVVAPAKNDVPSKLAVGKAGLLQPGLLIQTWLVADHTDETTTTFRMRRAELSVKGELVPERVGYTLGIDPAKLLEFQDSVIAVANQDPAPSDPAVPETVKVKQPVGSLAILQDVFVTFKSPYADLSMGQLKIPVSYEGYNSSSKLMFAERALAARQWGDKRDIGVRVAKSFEYVGYSMGVFNGSGANALDNNKSKEGALRLELYPQKGLTVAGVAYATLWEREEAGTKDRYEADLRFEKGPLVVQGELIRARDVGANDTFTHAQGYYGAIAYKIIADVESCLRVGYLDPDTNANLDPATAKGKDEVYQYDIGFNWYIQKNESKLQLNYSRLHYDDKDPADQVVLAAQVSF